MAYGKKGRKKGFSSKRRNRKGKRSSKKSLGTYKMSRGGIRL